MSQSHRAESPAEHRLRSLARRAAALPGQIEAWIAHAEPGATFARNMSQLEALRVFMGHITGRVTASCRRVEACLASQPDDYEALESLDGIEAAVFRSQRVWGFFRDKLSQRFIPEASRILALADLVAYDCYETARRSAERLGLSGTLGLRDYPLVGFIDDDSSPLTWARNVAMPELDDRLLPVPVIGIPWDHAANPWELLSLHHEVGHDIDGDLGHLSEALGASLEQTLGEAGVPRARARAWRRWSGEVLADAFGVALAGPPFVSFLTCLLPSTPVRRIHTSPGDVHPPPYLRVPLAARLVERLPFGAGAASRVREVAGEWNAPFQDSRPAVAAYVDDLELVVDRLLAPLPVDARPPARLTDLVAVSARDDDAQLRGTEALLRGAGLPTELAPRLAVGAAALAFRADPSPDFAERLVAQMLDHAQRAMPSPQLPLREERSSRHLRALADAAYGSAASLVQPRTGAP